MLSELITWVLNTYLGKYLEDFNSAQLSVALLSGAVELENVPIKKDALKTFGIPVQVYSGIIGKIKLQIPVRQFRTAPWCIIIERVYGVFGPKNLDEWDDEQEKNSDFEYKIAQLEAKESQWRVETGQHCEYYSSSYSSWLSYGTSLATTILENLELKITDVHIRYEDPLTVKVSPFVAGIRIKSLIAQSCDSNWNPGSKMTSNPDISYKLIELNDFAIYWNQLYDENICSNLGSKDLLIQMNDISNMNDNKYVINPISARAQCKRERCKQAIRSKLRPRLSCEFLIPTVQISISDFQYQKTVECVTGLNKLNKIRSFRMMRPACKVSENVIEWWKYAAKCYGYHFYTKELKWQIFRENIRYIRIYKGFLINPSDIISVEDKQFKLQLERNRTLAELQTLRNVCFANAYIKDLCLKNRNVNQSKNMLFQWFPNWRGWYGNAELNQAQDEMFKNIENDFLDALENTMENNTFSKRDTVFAYFSFTLTEGKLVINILNANNLIPKFEMDFQNLVFLVEMKPRLNSYLIGVSIGSVCIKDKFTDKTEFPFLIKPQALDMEQGASISVNTDANTHKRQIFEHFNNKNEAWFQLQYEKGPTEVQTDVRLLIKSKGLDIVYNEAAFKWLILFFTKPLNSTELQAEKDKSPTINKLKFLQNWKHLLLEKKEYRKTWSLEIDISAPRIILVENFFNKNTKVVLVDFGRFELLKDEYRKEDLQCMTTVSTTLTCDNDIDVDDESDELFKTPCSTPPGSKISCSESPTISEDLKFVINNNTGLENAFHNKIYDTYKINLTDLQVLVCKSKECNFVGFKNSTNVHLLNKFNISMELERRVIHTVDPEYPSITLYGTLPKITAHVNEQKLNDVYRILKLINFENIFQANEYNNYSKDILSEVGLDSNEDKHANLVKLQFVVGQLTLEVQSYEKSIAELQIIGIRVGISKIPNETSIHLSVYGLLLVDAMQSFGPDYELLMASHRHVGMDSVSGSLKQSEPCSPSSPVSPDPPSKQHSLTPLMINTAVNNIKLGKLNTFTDLDEVHSLISIEIKLVYMPSEKHLLTMANITFNNLDIIANQESIMELLEFMKRIAFIHNSSEMEIRHTELTDVTQIKSSIFQLEKVDINFNFNRLNILVMRTVKKHNHLIARKVGTLTMIEAEIHGIFGKDKIVAGSLGGIQMINIAPEGIIHQRIFSVGKDPLTEISHINSDNLMSTLTSEMYNGNNENTENGEKNALAFKICRNVDSLVNVKIRMASVWYTHSPQFIMEINFCVSQFKKYLKSFARSVREKATGMALGLVQHITIPNENIKKEDESILNFNTDRISIDIILNSPVVILPLSNDSPEVLIANLGKITAYNTHDSSGYLIKSDEKNLKKNLNIWKKDKYFVDIRNIKLFSLNIAQRKGLKLLGLPKADEFYSCESDAFVILHDTALLFQFTKDTNKSKDISEWNYKHNILVEGSVTQPLQVSLTRAQYEHMTECFQNALKINMEKNDLDNDEGKNEKNIKLDSIENSIYYRTNIKLTVPLIKLELKNEHSDPLINIIFREFNIQHTKKENETTVQIILKSILMEDLKCTKNPLFRNMVNSDFEQDHASKRRKRSKSCPNLSNLQPNRRNLFISLPSKLNMSLDTINNDGNNIIKNEQIIVKKNHQSECPDDNLVIYNLKTIDSLNTDSSSTKRNESSIKFNCLNLIISVDRWFMVLEFFGLISNNNIKNLISGEEKKNSEILLYNSQVDVSIKSLNLILVRNEEGLSKANISNAFFKIIKQKDEKIIEGHLGSMSLYDLTQYGTLYREKFSTSGTEALNFVYKSLYSNMKSRKKPLDKDAHLHIEMSSVRYIHTKRFLIEIHLFIKELLQLQAPVINNIKSNNLAKENDNTSIHIGLQIYAASPIVLLPLSYQSDQLIIADLGRISIENSFHFENEKIIISKKRNPTQSNDILEIMFVELENINLFAGERIPTNNMNTNRCIYISDFAILKKGSNLFKETCHLKLQIERNINSGTTHNYPDITVKGTLSKLNGIINIQQYKLIRGFLNYNLGEMIDDVYFKYRFSICEPLEKLSSIHKLNHLTESDFVWNILTINLLLENVSIRLMNNNEFNNYIEDLVCINFIKSSLEIDLYSDGSQDIDLISTEILIMDSTKAYSENEFDTVKYILKPTIDSLTSSVQAEIHCRKNKGSNKYTILLNNMRIMAILDCLGRLKNFLQEDSYMPSPVSQIYLNTAQKSSSHKTEQENIGTLEIIVNITDSEIVFVENFNCADSNAIILKSTTVFAYKPSNLVPISVNINHLEIFSCILGSEEISALSIIDPFTLNIELRNNSLTIAILKELCIRLSYNDSKLITKLIRSIPKQSTMRKNTGSTLKYDLSTRFEQVSPLIAMGFDQKDCWHAMEIHNFKLNEAALWLTQKEQSKNSNKLLDIYDIIINANQISVCIIDDCLDADVPLLEILFSQLCINQILKQKITEDTICTPFYLNGKMEAIIASDYYNRRLSGWEPVIESWECSANWQLSEFNSNQPKSINVNIYSKQLLKVNVTSTLIELYDLVRENWSKDFYNSSFHSNVNEKNITSNFRHRLPFIPFALENLTGEPMIFKTIFAQPGGIIPTEINQQDIMYNWIAVQPNEIIPFDFGPQTKLRHRDSHKLNMHQILIQIFGWSLVGPLSIDKVGTYFRYSTLDLYFKKRTRIVFDISLKGSAQKLITVRSALNIENKLNMNLFLKMESQFGQVSQITFLKSQRNLSIPLKLIDNILYIKPSLNSEHDNELCENIEKDRTRFINLNFNNTKNVEASIENFDFCATGISWKNSSSIPSQELITCFNKKKSSFHVLLYTKRNMYSNRDAVNMPGHTMTFLPPLIIRNMLCCELFYKINDNVDGSIAASEYAEVFCINPNETFNLCLTLDNYKLSGQLKIPAGHTGIVEPKLKLIDLNNRELYLRISIQFFHGNSMEIYISAPIWIINKTGLALIYRQEGTNHIASGQFEEHERARVVAPLMFSFYDHDGLPALEIRLGTSYGMNNQWCKSFSIHKEIFHRELKSEYSEGCYTIGINVKRGRGAYFCTTFVTLSPRFHLFNKTSLTLEFAQKCDASKFITHRQNTISALPGCNFPFHWPNCEEEPLLCVRIADVEFCNWSNAIPVNEVQSLYINIRNDCGEMNFLRLEVIAKEATYILLFSDAYTLPPPIRVDNYSEVLIHFFQCGCKPHWRTPVRPKSSLAYVLDDFMGIKSLQIEAPGGNSAIFPLNKMELTYNITYANFIYIAFRETFISNNYDSENNFEHLIQDQQLVLGVKDRRVIISKKCTGDRSQLWLMNSNGQLEHEGSSPPNEFGKMFENASRMVLDLEKAPNPTEYTNLVIRPPNKQRITTQTWRFENGRLMCHANMCVQAKNGTYGLKSGFDAVVGKIEQTCANLHSKLIPFDQSIEIQKFRPGSGNLEIIAKMDGPIQTIQIHDVKSERDSIFLLSDPSWNHASMYNKTIENSHNSYNYSINCELPKGFSISIITRQPCEELAYITFEGIILKVFSTPLIKSLELKVNDLQIDNQLLDTSYSVLLHTSTNMNENPEKYAFMLTAKILPSPNENAIIFENLSFELKPCIVYLEERLILKVAFFLGIGKTSQSTVNLQHIYMNQNMDEKLTSKNYKRFYFENLQFGSMQIRLSVFTATKLSQDLASTKKAIGLTLIKFEDALIEFDKFSIKYNFETIEQYTKAIKTHYINQLKWHAASILGSVDFLGNPLGFANDLSEGVSGLIFEGSVKSLVKNVTHGISNSTAKLTETLSDSIGKVVLDEQDNEARQKILEIQANTSSSHLAAGLKGFGFGLLGGVTSIVRHTYDGAQSDGFPGFLSGLGKGIVGTVTKPLIGVLDLASETATAVRESSRGPHRSLPNRRRLPRCVTGAPGGLLPTYSYRQSRGQQYLYIINRRNFTEKLIAYEPNLCNSREAKLRLLVSTDFVRIFSRCEEDPAIMFECHLSEVLSCHSVTTNSGSNIGKTTTSYIEISTNLPKITRPRIRCQNEEISEDAARCINYAKRVFDEREHMITND